MTTKHDPYECCAERVMGPLENEFDWR